MFNKLIYTNQKNIFVYEKDLIDFFEAPLIFQKKHSRKKLFDSYFIEIMTEEILNGLNKKSNFFAFNGKPYFKHIITLLSYALNKIDDLESFMNHLAQEVNNNLFKSSLFRAIFDNTLREIRKKPNLYQRVWDHPASKMFTPEELEATIAEYNKSNNIKLTPKKSAGIKELQIIHQAIRRAVPKKKPRTKEQAYSIIGGLGTWQISSISDPRWNISGKGFVSLFLPDIIKKVIAKFADQYQIIVPQDLYISYLQE